MGPAARESGPGNGRASAGDEGNQPDNWETGEPLWGNGGTHGGANIQEKFNALGYHFGYTAQNPVIFEDGRPIAEVDILMEDDECSIAVEVKSKPVIRDITDHIKRLKALRSYKDKHNDKRKIHGAIAGAIMVNGVRDFALKKGLYVIEQTGDTVQIITPEGFKPGEW
jgi:hypothetical protein